MNEDDVRIRGYSKKDLMAMDIGSLRALLHERTHHTIEVMLYRILNGKMEKPRHFGGQAQLLLNIWKERSLPLDTPDLRWCIQMIEFANNLNTGIPVVLNTQLPKPFADSELEAVKKLLYGRRSIRQFSDNPIPEDVLREILYAGLMAPQGCNVSSTRFLILRDPEEWKLVRSDIPLEYGIMILICQDMRIYKTLNHDKLVPQNIFYDAAAAADHMCLMAHALGLGACWLTHGEKTQQRIREYYGLPETIVSRCHLIIGWPDEAPFKPQRMRLEDAILTRKS